MFTSTACSKLSYKFMVVSCFLFTTIGFWRTANAQDFLDVPSTLPEAIAINALSDAGIIKGYEDGSFKPNQTIIRAEALKIILLTFPRENGTIADLNFTDVNEADWFSEFVKKGIGLGIVQGYSDRTFKPAQIVNLAETLKMSLVAGDRDLASNVPDFAHRNIPQTAWFRTYFNYAYHYNLISMDDRGGVDPAHPMTRAEFVDLIYRVKESGSGKKFDLSYNWRNVKTKSGIETNYPLDWEAIEVTTGLILLHRDPTVSQVLNAHTFPYSAQMSVEILQGDKTATANEVLSKIANEYQAIYGLKDLVAERKQESGREVLSLHVPGQGILDYYIYLQNGLVLASQASYGSSEKKTDFIKTIYFLQKELDYLDGITPDSSNEQPKPGDDFSAAITKAREQILEAGAGSSTLQLFEDKTIIETDVLGVGTGPVDYYYSAKANITIKLERVTDTILDIQSGKTSAF